MKGTATVKTIMPEGDYKIEDTIAILTDEEGNDIPVTMIQRWPVKRAMTNYKEKPRPFKLLETGVRVIDTLNPIWKVVRDLSPGRSVQVKRCFSMLFLSRRKRISLSLQLAVNVRMRWWKSLPSSPNW